MQVFNEQDSINLRLKDFKNDRGAALLPSQITLLWYRVDELASGTNQVPQTNVASITDPLDVGITPAQNVMANAAKAREVVAITVRFEWGSGTGKTKMFLFQRKNLRFL